MHAVATRPTATNPTITIDLPHGGTRVLHSLAEVCGFVANLSREEKGTRRALVRKRLEIGRVLVQVRAKFPRGLWLKFLDQIEMDPRRVQLILAAVDAVARHGLEWSGWASWRALEEAIAAAETPNSEQLTAHIQGEAETRTEYRTEGANFAHLPDGEQESTTEAPRHGGSTEERAEGAQGPRLSLVGAPDEEVIESMRRERDVEAGVAGGGPPPAQRTAISASPIVSGSQMCLADLYTALRSDLAWVSEALEHDGLSAAAAGRIKRAIELERGGAA